MKMKELIKLVGKEWKQAKQNIIDIFNEDDDLDKYFKDYDQNKKDKK
tara:strand:+ start:676 stop:816 length:141 start_codon:yes stop_codon:yes gene_type:complete